MELASVAASASKSDRRASLPSQVTTRRKHDTKNAHALTIALQVAIASRPIYSRLDTDLKRQC
jgi:hypothetical protein